jgi:hypothetical protein
MDDGIRPVSFVLGESQKDRSAAVRIAALADESQPLRIGEAHATLRLVGRSKVFHA